MRIIKNHITIKSGRLHYRYIYIQFKLEKQIASKEFELFYSAISLSNFPCSTKGIKFVV